MKPLSLITITTLQLLFTTPGFGYDEYSDSLPNWEERAVLVYTNACRMAPIAFRDRYIGNTSILLPQNYPAVAPLYRNHDLSSAARFHSVEMAGSCGMAHTCNGQTFDQRIRMFYTAGGYIGENIAAGYQTPQKVVNGWLIDGKSAQTAAPDGNGDGHRANIMKSHYKVIGCGYFLAGSGRNTKTYWCQDFGSKPSEFAYHPIAAASHLFFSSSEISFWSNVYDPSGTIATISLLLDNDRFLMKLDIGSASAGTYAVTLPRASGCRFYRIEVLYSDGHTVYYPEHGALPTTNEGSCRDVATIGVHPLPAAVNTTTNRHITTIATPRGITFAVTAQSELPLSTNIYSSSGILIMSQYWSGKTATLHTAHLANGIKIAIHRFANGTTLTQKLPVKRY